MTWISTTYDQNLEFHGHAESPLVYYTKMCFNNAHVNK